MSELQVRSKWTRYTASIKLGTLGLIHDLNQPPTKWSLARVIKTLPGDDNVVRVITLQTLSGTVLQRPVSKFSPLPTMNDCDEMSSPGGGC